MKSLLISCIMAGLLLGSTNAFAEGAKAKQGGAEKPAKKAMPALKDVSATGKIVKEEMTKKDKEGKEMKAVKYALQTADAKIVLPLSKDIDLAAMVDKDVTVEGQGFEKDGKVRFRKITKVTEAAQ